MFFSLQKFSDIQLFNYVLGTLREENIRGKNEQKPTFKMLFLYYCTGLLLLVCKTIPKVL